MALPLIPQVFVRTDISLNTSFGALVVEAYEDGALFVVKPHNKAISSRSAVNELIAVLLGRLFNGPFLKPYLVNLDKKTLSLPSLRQRQTFAIDTLKPGLAFGIDFFENRVDFAEVKNLVNPEQAIPILILDSWVKNEDRRNNGNVIFVSDKVKTKRGNNCTMYAIDHGITFGGDWTIRSLQTQKRNLRIEDHLEIIYKLAREHSAKRLNEYLSKAEAITVNDLEQILNEIPMSWGVSDKEKKALLDYLLTRQSLLRPAIESFLAF